MVLTCGRFKDCQSLKRPQVSTNYRPDMKKIISRSIYHCRNGKHWIFNSHFLTLTNFISTLIPQDLTTGPIYCLNYSFDIQANFGLIKSLCYYYHRPIHLCPMAICTDYTVGQFSKPKRVGVWEMCISQLKIEFIRLIRITMVTRGQGSSPMFVWCNVCSMFMHCIVCELNLQHFSNSVC